jgi:hypothetical protein
LLIGRSIPLPLCACAAPTPAPTNMGDTNPPTRAPTAPPRSLAPTFAPTLLSTISPTFAGGARCVHSDAAGPSDGAGPAPWYRQYRARGYLHGAPAHSRATAALGTGCPSWTGRTRGVLTFCCGRVGQSKPVHRAAACTLLRGISHGAVLQRARRVLTAASAPLRVPSAK